ncbi:MAG: hypothetical protein R3C01_02220 [Planctomycetaceae bacterium]
MTNYFRSCLGCKTVHWADHCPVCLTLHAGACVLDEPVVEVEELFQDFDEPWTADVWPPERLDALECYLNSLRMTGWSPPQVEQPRDPIARFLS